MLSLTTYYDCRQENSTLPIPMAMQQAVTLFIKEAADAIKQDTEEEGVSSSTLLVKGKNFKDFCKNHEEELQAFGCFVFDHRGVYDKDPLLYHWETIYPFTIAVFQLGIQMPYRSRLIELTQRYDLAYFAMDDPEVCSFVAQNFKTYADIKDKFFDEHGRAQTIFERMYPRLHQFNCQRPFVHATPQWCLMNLIYQYLYAEKA